MKQSVTLGFMHSAIFGQSKDLKKKTINMVNSLTILPHLVLRQFTK